MAPAAAAVVGAASCARAAGMAAAENEFFARKGLGQHHCSSVPRANSQPRVVCIAAPSSITKPLQPANNTIDDSTDDYQRALTSQYVEHACWLDGVEGQIPPEIEGTLLRNGPGLFETGDGQEINRFDGDGMVCMYAIRDGRVFFRNKFVRTKGFLEEQRAGKRLYRGVFTAEKGNLFQSSFKIKNTANTGVIFWGGRLLALQQGEKPYDLDQQLNTLGEFETFPADGTCSDYAIRYDADGSKKLGLFHPEWKGLYTNLKIWEVNEEFETVAVQEVNLPGSLGMLFFHKLTMTENYYVLYGNSLSLNIFKFLTDSLHGSVSLYQCLNVDSRRSRIHVIPRPGRKNVNKYWSPEPRSFATPPCFILHPVNCYEMDDGRYLIFDVLPYKDDRIFNNEQEEEGKMVRSGSSGYTRFVVDLLTGDVSKSSVDIKDIEFPYINPSVGGKPHQYAYFVGAHKDSDASRRPITYLSKISIDPAMSNHEPINENRAEKDIWVSKPRSFLQEPVFVPKKDAKNEDDGWILSVCFNVDTMTNDLLIFDATNIPDGPVAKVHLPFHIPIDFHGFFTKAYMGPQNGHFASSSYDIREGV